MSAPSAKIEIVDNGLGLLDLPPGDVACFIGCSSKGPLNTPTPIGSVSDLTETFGNGETVEDAALTLAKTGRQIVFVRIAKTTVNQALTVDEVNWTGTATIAVTGTAADDYDVIFEMVTPGTIDDVDPATGTYHYSLDNGDTFTSAVAVPNDGVIALGTSGLTVTLSGTNNNTLEGSFTVAVSTPPAPAVRRFQLTRIASSTSVVTASGTPEDTYDVIWECTAGGTIGTAGIKYRYSLDGGANYTAERSLGTANTLELMDTADASTGVTLNYAAGTLDAGDKVTWRGNAPQWQGADIPAAILAIKTSSVKVSFIVMVGVANAAKAGTLGTELADLAVKNRLLFGVLDTRRPRPYETEAQWIADLLADTANFADTRIAMGAGFAHRSTSAISGRSYRRPAAWFATARLVARPLQEDPGRVLTGALSSDVTIHEDGQLVEHNADMNSALHDARYITLRTHVDVTGVFITKGNMMKPEGSDFDRVPLRRVMDRGAIVFRNVAVQQLENQVFVNPAGTPNPGGIREVDARKVEREVRTALENELLVDGKASAVAVHVSRTEPILTSKKLKCDVKITPLGYVDDFEGTISFTNPQFQILQAA